MGNKRKVVEDGEWVFPKMNGYEMECCDCGLVHKFDFLVVDGDRDIVNGFEVAWRAYRQYKRKKKERKL